jgi:hypothetical protein
MNHTLHTLPLSNSFTQLPGEFYAQVEPTPFSEPARLIHFNSAAAELIELDCAEQHALHFVQILSGAQRLDKAANIAMCYAGHQFGYYVPQLGDGRAIMVGETTNSRGERWEIQLKGSGPTPFSRNGDGRAVLRSTVREYLCSEAMHGLGIPTTRALCITGSDEKIYRESVETGAVLTRLAPSHVRFGSFEYFYYLRKYSKVQQLLDYVIEHHYPQLRDQANPYLALLQEVIERTAKLIAQWQSVGFCHGVMNTDNMSILGLTIDYGPFGFLDGYNPKHICNHSDHEGRYAYDQQPEIGLWNLACLAQTMTKLVEEHALKSALADYSGSCRRYYQQQMADKLGFENASPETDQLLKTLLQQMQASQTDFTRLFRELGNVQRDSEAPHTALRDMFFDRETFDRWLQDYRRLLRANAQDDPQRRAIMEKTNPKYVLRNYLGQQAIAKALEKDYSEIDKLMQVLQSPFDEHLQLEHYAAPPPNWAQEITMSCSS